MNDKIYSANLALLTDLYQVTMAYGYWKAGRVEDEAVFHLFFRRAPFNGGYALACGLEIAMDYLQDFRFTDDDISYLASLTGNNGGALFDRGFLDYLRGMDLRCDVDAVPEGTVVFPHEPLLRVKGPLILGQLLETPLLNLVNYQTLCATKAARICDAAKGEPVLEFGLRRAQGIDGALAASRAAYIGGCSATSNMLAGKLFGIPVKGTHAHSWVMSFDSEQEAFARYADAMPNNCVFLVDTYDTIEGVRKAVAIGKELRKSGHEMVGIRLDSGDLAQLSRDAREILDEGGFPEAGIVASNDLDEHAIAELKRQGAKIGIWGVGTKLVTAYDQPALDGVYKLSAIRHAGRPWVDCLKLSEDRSKTTTPGMQQVRRHIDGSGRFLGDGIYDVRTPPGRDAVFVGMVDPGDQRHFGAACGYEALLVPVFEQGRCVYQPPPLDDVRARSRDQLARLPDSVRGLEMAAPYFVGLEEHLARLRQRLIQEKKRS